MSKETQNVNHKIAVFISIILLLSSFVYIPGAESVSASAIEELFVAFIDVGQGDSSLLSTSSGINILIDGGPTSAGQTVLSYITNEGVNSIDVIVISHQHSDHIGGLQDVFQSEIPIDLVLYNGNNCTTVTCNNVWAAMDKRGIIPQHAKQGDTFQWGSIRARVLNPQNTSSGDENEDSVVMEIEFFDTKLLYTGDIGFSTENVLVNAGSLRSPVDVLKVAHHGSKHSTSTTFLDAIKPLNAVISVGTNSYGHPTPETLSRLGDSGAKVYRTDKDGHVTFTFLGGETDQESSLVYLPLILNNTSSTTEPNPTEPMPGENMKCNTIGNAEICASVSNASPKQYSSVTVYGRLTVNGSGQQNKTMNTTWHYKTTTSYCDGPTGSDGLGSCQRSIGGASIGYQVNIDVSIDGYQTTTSFTPVE